MLGLKEARISTETTSQPKASKALPTDLVPQKSSNSRGIFDIACDFRKSDSETLARQYHPNELVVPTAFADIASGYAERGSFLALWVLAALSLELLLTLSLELLVALLARLLAP